MLFRSEMSIVSVNDENDQEEEEMVVPIWTIPTCSVVNDETGEVMIPPQTPYEFALKHYSVSLLTDTATGEDDTQRQAILQLLQDVMATPPSDDENDNPDECDVDVTTGLCRPSTPEHDEEEDENDDEMESLLSFDIPSNSNDILADALRDFEEMKQG